MNRREDFVRWCCFIAAMIALIVIVAVGSGCSGDKGGTTGTNNACPSAGTGGPGSQASGAGGMTSTSGGSLTGAGGDAGTGGRAHVPLDLDKLEDNLEAFVKTRGALDETQDVIFYWTGAIYAFVAADPNAMPTGLSFGAPILGFEGYNVARFVKKGDGYRMLSREASFYEDVKTGAILDCWANPLKDPNHPAKVSVVHVFNDPVNFDLQGLTAHTDLGGSIVFQSDVLLTYPSILPVAIYSRYSAGNTYQSNELFNFYVARADLEDPALPSAPVEISWTRFGQYLPWMQMGQAPGQLIYQTRGKKLLGGYDDLPQKIRGYVEVHAPEYKAAPMTDASPNATSWSYFKQLYDSGKYTDTCN